MAPVDDASARLRVEVVYCPQPGHVDSVDLDLPAGSTLADALRVSGLLARHGLDPAGLQAGVWSRRQPLEMALRDGDRVEVYRPLTVDPKEARRLRYKRHRAVAGAGTGAGEGGGETAPGARAPAA